MAKRKKRKLTPLLEVRVMNFTEEVFTEQVYQAMKNSDWGREMDVMVREAMAIGPD